MIAEISFEITMETSVELHFVLFIGRFNIEPLVESGHNVWFFSVFLLLGQVP